jgi:hypothetical protein
MIDIINGVINAVGVVLSQLLGLLPTSPLVLPSGAYTTLATYMGYAAWLLPLGEIGTVITALLAATLIWYGIRFVMRFVRVVAA